MRNLKRRNTFLFGFTTIVFTVILCLVIFSNKDMLKTKTKMDRYMMSELEETKKDISDFKIDIIGAYEGEISPTLMNEKDKKAYEFSAGISKGKKVETIEFVGYKLSDIMDATNIYEYSTLEFKSTENIVSIVKEINDKIFLVFMKNNKKIDPTLLVVDKEYEKNSLENVEKLYITNNPEEVDDTKNFPNDSIINNGLETKIE